MKKLIAAIVLLTGVIFCSLGVFAQGVTVFVNDAEQNLKAVIENDSSLLPVREIFEALDADVYWNEKAKTVMAFSGINVLRIKPGEDAMYVNDKEVVIDTPAKIINDLTYIPVRAASEAFGAEVRWDEDTKSVYITRKAGDHNIKKEIKNIEFKDDNGQIIANALLTYPKIENNEGIDKISNINTEIENRVQEIAENLKKSFSMVTLPDEEPYLYYLGYEATYDKSNLLSIVEQGFITIGTEISADYLNAVSYSLENGNVLKMEDIFNFTKADMKILNVYDFYFYDDCAILVLPSENIDYYYYYQYPAYLMLYYDEETKNFFKKDIITGKDKEYTTPSSMFSSGNQVQIVEQQEFKAVEALNYAVGFNMTEVIRPIYELVGYRKIVTTGEVVGVVEYIDLDQNTMTLKKARGDLDISYRNGVELKQGYTVENSYINFYEDEIGYYATFSCLEEDGELYCYCVEISTDDDMELDRICKEIIEKVTAK